MFFFVFENQGTTIYIKGLNEGQMLMFNLQLNNTILSQKKSFLPFFYYYSTHLMGLNSVSLSFKLYFESFLLRKNMQKTTKILINFIIYRYRLSVRYIPKIYNLRNHILSFIMSFLFLCLFFLTFSHAYSFSIIT